jgi:predicted tellurium resistance membrane protein TerC
MNTLFNMPLFSHPDTWLSLLTLTFLEIILGIDNIIFISILASKVEEEKRAFIMRTGLLLAMIFRIALLFGITWLIALTKPWFSFEWIGIGGSFTGQSMVLIAGGIFLLYKATTEIGHKLEGPQDETSVAVAAAKRSLIGIFIQIILIDMVFSFDSILTAVGMTSGLQGAIFIMVISVIIAILVMMIFANPVSKFVNNHPTVQMLALSFLILIGFMLIAEGAHFADFHLGDQEIGAIPKGYLYFAITFSLLVEFLNMRLRKKAAS